MQVSLKWLKDYVDINISAEELAHKLTTAGLEVGGIRKLGENITKVVVGEILEVNPHPNADKLVVCVVKVGEEKPLTIVTGASNVKAGMKVPVALVGATLPGGTTIGKAVFRGVESYGMLCSAQELGIDPTYLSEEEKNGILSLPADTPLGSPIQELLGLDDVIFEVDLTPNRSDCLSVINLAREISAITSAPLKLPNIPEEGAGNIDQLIKIEIKDKDLCYRYVARVVKDVKIGPSPLWLQHRLQAAGMRPINNIVDITNFVMLEMGQPLHAFDYDKINGHSIIVRRAKEGETIVTLDGNERKLDESMLVIADAKGPTAIAGVMGGLESEITENTKTILLESAFFEGANIRKTSRKLGLRSEASSRFEKGVNIEGAVLAINRAVDLIEQLGAGVGVPGKIDVYPSKAEKLTIKFRPSRANSILGTSLTSQEMLSYFKRLSFDCEIKDDDLILVTPPSYRRDITMEIDLVEEVARLYGYENIPTTMPEGVMTRSVIEPSHVLEDKIREILIGCGMREVINYSFIGEKSFDKLKLEPDNSLRNCIRIMNPLRDDQNVMRTTLIPGMLEVAALNINRRQLDLALFEIGKVFLPQGPNELPKEQPSLAGLITGGQKKSWNWTAEKYDFYYLKGILEKLLDQLNQTEVEFVPANNYSSFHPGRTAEIMLDRQKIGVIGEVHPLVLQEYEIEQRVWIFELRLDPLLANFTRPKHYKALPKYPAVERDMAFLVPEEITVNAINEKIAAVGGEYLVEFRLFDVYKGQQIPEGFKSMAYNMVYQAPDRTLTDKEVTEIHNRIQEELQASFGAKLR